MGILSRRVRIHETRDFATSISLAASSNGKCARTLSLDFASILKLKLQRQYLFSRSRLPRFRISWTDQALDHDVHSHIMSGISEHHDSIRTQQQITHLIIGPLRLPHCMYWCKTGHGSVLRRRSPVVVDSATSARCALELTTHRRRSFQIPPDNVVTLS